MSKKITVIISFFFLFIFLKLEAQRDATVYALDQMMWIENQMRSMSAKERIGQLFMVAAYSEKDQAHINEVSRMITDYNIGGLIFFKGNPTKQAEQTNAYQAKAKVPLLVAIDGEWGLSMRLSDTPKYPRQLMLGAIQDNSLIFDMGKDIAEQCKRMGIHINLAPVVDVNNNPNNPVIGDRSFGEDRKNVAEKSVAYMQGMEMNGVMACAKHFPGHGDTDKDSHHTLPSIPHDVSRLDSIELYPFKKMIEHGISGIMIAHLALPALDGTPINGVIAPDSPTMPATLSQAIVSKLLIEDMNYNGLIFTDALNMKGVSKYYEPGIVDVKALLAGNDILLFPENVGKAVQEIEKAVKQGLISQAEIDRRVEKILRAKFNANLQNIQPVKTPGLISDLNKKESTVLIRKLVANALTLAKNEQKLVPALEVNRSFASVAIGTSATNTFQRTLSKYARFNHFQMPKDASKASATQMIEKLKQHDVVYVSFHDMTRKASKNFGITKSSLDFIYRLQQETKVVVTLFGSPYSLQYFDRSPNVLVSYQDNKMTQELSAQLLFGAIQAKGKLPVTASAVYPYGAGELTQNLGRLRYGMAEEVQMDGDALEHSIDKVVKQAINGKMAPGCQILVAKDGMVIFEKAYGYHTYSKKQEVQMTDVYDLASITKIAASAMGMMKMYESGDLQLDDTLGDLLPELKSTNKAKVKVRDIMTHQSGLQDWIPFYEETLNNRSTLYKKEMMDGYTIPVADNMYMKDAYQDVIWQRIVESPIKAGNKYKYSDLGYYIFKRMIERYASTSLNQYVESNFHNPLGLYSLSYKPLDKLDKEMIVPTEKDDKFRKQLLRGHVHDMGAAMQGGIGGHAGLFGKANDLAVLMQMYLNGGTYGGKKYFDEETIAVFTKQQNNNCRRGLCFDKPEMDRSRISPASHKASEEGFGHSGFTGTCVWADPKYDLIYVFLSNRIHPTMTNSKLVKENIRTRIQDAIYNEAIRAESKKLRPNNQ